jgi:hypothetical protein
MSLNKKKEAPKEKVAITAPVVKDFLDLLDKIGGIENFPESIKVWKAYRYKYEIEDCISAEEIATLYRHDDDGNVFNIKTGKQVGHHSIKDSCLRIDLYYKHYRFQVSSAKIVFCLVHKRWAEKGLDVDHKDNDKLNNRPSNLREGTKSDNMSNRRQLIKTKSGSRGIEVRKYTIVARVQRNKKRYIKYFSIKKYGSKEKATLAAKTWRDVTAKELHGEFFNEN